MENWKKDPENFYSERQTFILFDAVRCSDCFGAEQLNLVPAGTDFSSQIENI